MVATMVPLSRDLRSRVASQSSSVVSYDQAVDLSDVLTPRTRGAPDRSDLCSEQLAKIPEPSATKKAIVAYLQYGSPSQLSAADNIRQLLKQGGVDVPGAELVKAVPQANEIRVCRSKDMPIAERMTAAFSKCNLGAFIPRKIGSCQSVPRIPTVEIWLGQTKP